MKAVGESGTSSVLMMIIAGVLQQQANPGEGGGNDVRAAQCLLVEDQTARQTPPKHKLEQQGD